MCALYKKREDVPSNIAHQLTEALIQGTDSILVLGEKFRIHVNIVKSMGISCLGRAMFNAREQKARALLFNNIIACLKQGLDSYTICKRLGIQAKVLYAIAPEYAHCNWQDLVEQYKTKDEDVVEDPTDSEPEEFGFIQVTDNATEAEAEVAPTETAPASAPVKRDTPRVPGKYYPVDRCQGYQHHDKRYNKPYQDRRQQSQHNNNFGGYQSRDRPYNQRQYHDRRPYYNSDGGRGNSPNYHNNRQQVPFNQVQMRYQDMEFSFNCGTQDPREVVLDLMRKVKAGKL